MTGIEFPRLAKKLVSFWDCGRGLGHAHRTEAVALRCICGSGDFSPLTWSCHNPKHNHQTREVALRCVAAHEKRERSKERNKVMSKDAIARRRAELAICLNVGLTRAQIAERFGVSRSRVDSLIWQLERDKRSAEHDRRFTWVPGAFRDATSWGLGSPTHREARLLLSEIGCPHWRDEVTR